MSLDFIVTNFVFVAIHKLNFTVLKVAHITVAGTINIKSPPEIFCVGPAPTTFIFQKVSKIFVMLIAAGSD